MHANTRTNLPCRHSGIRPQHDPSVKLYGNDGCLKTEGKAINIYIIHSTHPQFNALHISKSLKDITNLTYSSFHLLRQPLGPCFFQHAAALQTLRWRRQRVIGGTRLRHKPSGELSRFYNVFLRSQTFFTARKLFRTRLVCQIVHQTGLGKW